MPHYIFFDNMPFEACGYFCSKNNHSPVQVYRLQLCCPNFDAILHYGSKTYLDWSWSNKNMWQGIIGYLLSIMMWKIQSLTIPSQWWATTPWRESTGLWQIGSLTGILPETYHHLTNRYAAFWEKVPHVLVRNSSVAHVYTVTWQDESTRKPFLLFHRQNVKFFLFRQYITATDPGLPRCRCNTLVHAETTKSSSHTSILRESWQYLTLNYKSITIYDAYRHHQWYWIDALFFSIRKCLPNSQGMFEEVPHRGFSLGFFIHEQCTPMDGGVCRRLTWVV